MERVVVLGSMGAGKSTLARALGAKTGLPVIHLDAHFWRPGWIEPARSVWAEQQRELVAGERWIMDGGYHGTLAIRLARADTVIWLQINRWICLWRVVWRRVRDAGRRRPDRAEGCSERLDLIALRWVLEYPRTKHAEIERQLAEHPGIEVVRLRRRREVAQFLKQAS